MSDSTEHENLREIIRTLETELKSKDTAEDEEVVKMTDRGAFETNFDSKRVQLRFLRQIMSALETKDSQTV